MMLPITTLGDVAVAGMLARAQDANVRGRQQDAERRILMMSENWRELVWAHIDTRIKTPAVRAAIKARVSRTHNVLLQILRKVCVSYKIPPIRTLTGASDEAQKTWSRLMTEAHVPVAAKQWERQTFALNVILVVPRVQESPHGLGPQLRYHAILPDRCEVWLDERDPKGTPVRAQFWEKHPGDHERDPWRLVVLDDEAWRYLDQRGNVIETHPHNAGIFPGAVFRLDEAEDDWWSSFRGEGMVDATIAAAYVAARRDWVRDGQDRRKEIVSSAEMNQIPQQVAGAEGPLHIPVAPGLFSYDVIEAITTIDEFQKHISAYIRQAAEYIGVPAQLVDFDATDGAGDDRAAMMHAALADLRADNIEYYRIAEHDLAWKTSLVLRGAGHPASRLLPPDMVRDSFSIDYPELTFVETPSARIAAAKERIGIGLSSTFREYRREHPELTLEQARTEVLAFAAEEGELNQYFIQNNIPRGADARLKTIAQLQGAMGGEASGEARQPEEDDDGHRSDDAADDDAADDERPAGG